MVFLDSSAGRADTRVMDSASGFGIVEILGIAASVSLLSGWRLYLTVLATGIAMRGGLVAGVETPDQGSNTPSSGLAGEEPQRDA